MKKVNRIIDVAMLMTTVLAVSGAAMADTAGQQPTPTKPAPATIVDDGDAGWIWSGMSPITDQSLQGGSAHVGGPGSYGAYTFHGTGVDVTGITGPTLSVDGRVHKIGRAKFSLDGKAIGSISAVTPDTVYGVNLLHVIGLSDGNHVLQIEPVGGWIGVDSITVSQSVGDAPVVSTTTTVDKVTEPVIPAGAYRIVLHMDPTKCLSAHDVFPVDGTLSEIYHVSEDRQQVWNLQPLDGGVYRISPSTEPDQALSVLPTVVKNTGNAIGTWHYSNDKHQQWIIVPTTGGFYRLISAADPADVVELMWANNNDGSEVIEFNWHGSNNQEWGFRPVKY